MQVPELIELLQRKGLILQINYVKPTWTLEVRGLTESNLVSRVVEPEFPMAVHALLQELHLLD